MLIFSIAWFRVDVDLTNFFLWKSAIYHSIKLPFDAEVAEKILNFIYFIGSKGEQMDVRKHGGG